MVDSRRLGRCSRCSRWRTLDSATLILRDFMAEIVRERPHTASVPGDCFKKENVPQNALCFHFEPMAVVHVVVWFGIVV